MKKIKYFKDLKGETIISIEGAEQREPEIVFTLDNGRIFKLYHNQDCCETVLVEDVCGDISDLIGIPLLESEESSSSRETTYGGETWTFYKLGTIKGHVNIRWLGRSNGCYSEAVDFCEVK